MPEKALKNVAAKYHLTTEQVTELLRLLDSGYAVAYVMRYHKELAAGLSPEGFHEIVEERRRAEKLDSRRRKILKKLKEREVLTEDLEEKMNRADDLVELIDYYVPYRPRKRSASRQALAQGLRPLATQVLSQEEFIPDMAVAAQPYVAADKGLPDVESALEGVFHIVSDWVAEEKAHRDRQRGVFRQDAFLVATRASRSLPGRLIRDFRAYFDYRQKASKVHPYHMLTILRGKRMKVLQYHIEAPMEAMLRAAAELYLAGGAAQLEQVLLELGAMLPVSKGPALKGLNGTEFLVACIHHSLLGTLADIAARELDKDLCRRAEALGLQVIWRNLRSLLMAQPLAKPVLGIHPGYRTGCGLAALDAAGKVLETATVYPHPPQNEQEPARQTICRLVEQHKLEAVVIGDGTGSEETEGLIAGLIADKFPDLQYTVVPEVGVEAYVASRAARNELPSAAPGELSAVALSRRLQDPLSELTKVNPRDLCLQPYVDDVNGGALKKLLDRALEQCVCEVGVDVNAAHQNLLRYVPGVGPDRALELVDYREKNGPIKNKAQLCEVPRFGAEAFERAAGFLRVGGSDNPLDLTRIHPRFYPVAEDVCSQLQVPLAELATPEGRQRLKQKAGEVKLAELEKRFGVHYLLLKDTMAELSEPWPDPRQQGRPPVLRKRRATFDELTAGQWLTGVVRNIVDFGVFVDVGVGEDGLVHISELADSFVQSPYDVACVGDVVTVRVARVDTESRRIALSMRSESARREVRPREGRPRRPGARVRTEAAAVAAEDVPDRKPGGPVQTPRSTLGWESRRVRKASLTTPLSKTQQAMLKKPEPQPQPPEQAEAAEGEEKPKPALGGLLEKLGFASIERRGEANE